MKETDLNRDLVTAKIGVIKVTRELFPGELLKVKYSIQEGVFHSFVHSVISIREVKKIEEGVKKWVAEDHPIELLCQKDGYYHYQTGGMTIKSTYPVNPRSSMVVPFDIVPFGGGFIVDFGAVSRAKGAPLVPPYQLSAAFEKGLSFLENIGVEIVADVNAFILSGKSNSLLDMAEALHEKEISDIADMILEQRRALRVLLISGPSSSGKTIFAQRLLTQLKVNGLKSVVLSLGDYFVDLDRTPRDGEGKYDFETLHALDLDLLKKHIAQLDEGQTVEMPQFDFANGIRRKETKPLSVGPSDVLVVEGLHALNPELMPDIDRRKLFKVFVSALGGLNIDLSSRIPTGELRLLRRIIKDNRTRGIGAEMTFERWPSVRRGEYANVFAYQEDADVMFNTSLIYELNALRPFAEKCLHEVKSDSPHYESRERLLNLLTFFEPMDISKVPFNSIIWEFTGGGLTGV
ncbi:uridine kinase family protein [Parasporobacterium paucivorans]|uniref:Uridine kinase n=1 Tax=Parasporobacterium paucivorans DSM 15970 TaxID=1122934 RepID=A0A1M6K0D7_9FIRM|nr:nucleoside kinase [Parasporobacterium paucivorans]SHJ52393.1 uridine kinase [Parasporobacterium paucivorans DSM 15970]